LFKSPAASAVWANGLSQLTRVLNVEVSKAGVIRPRGSWVTALEASEKTGVHGADRLREVVIHEPPLYWAREAQGRICVGLTSQQSNRKKAGTNFFTFFTFNFLLLPSPFLSNPCKAIPSVPSPPAAL